MTQLALFAEPVRLSRHDRMWQTAISPEVEHDMMAIFAARPDDWLKYSDFQGIQKKYDFTGNIGHVLSRLCRAGKLDEMDIYAGDVRPGGKNYQGYRTEYRLPKVATS